MCAREVITALFHFICFLGLNSRLICPMLSCRPLLLSSSMIVYYCAVYLMDMLHFVCSFLSGCMSCGKLALGFVNATVCPIFYFYFLFFID